MVASEVFQRARSPEQKAYRRAAILATAARLGTVNGVRGVSLGDIATAVGLTKSNVLRYFETREDIYLQLTAAGYRDWAARVIDRLDSGTAIDPSCAATALAESLAKDPLFCDLLSAGPATLEHNVSADAVRAFKRTLFRAIDDLAEVLARRLGGMRADQARQVLVATLMLASGLWPWCNPPPVLAGLYLTDAETVGTRPEFVPQLRDHVEALIAGMLRRTGA